MMSNTAVAVDPLLGDYITDLIERQTGREVEIILVVIPSEGGSPTFVTSLLPDIMEHVVAQLSEKMKAGPKGRTITGSYSKDELH
jgi:hypothetical protein